MDVPVTHPQYTKQQKCCCSGHSLGSSIFRVSQEPAFCDTENKGNLLMANLFLEIPDSFWGLFRSRNRQVYIDALLQINEEYQLQQLLFKPGNLYSDIK